MIIDSVRRRALTPLYPTGESEPAVRLACRATETFFDRSDFPVVSSERREKGRRDSTRPALFSSRGGTESRRASYWSRWSPRFRCRACLSASEGIDAQCQQQRRPAGVARGPREAFPFRTAASVDPRRTPHPSDSTCLSRVPAGLLGRPCGFDRSLT